MYDIADFDNPFEAIDRFETKLARYTGAMFVVATDCCTHAIELCLRFDEPDCVILPTNTYLSVPMTMHKLGIPYQFEVRSWTTEYLIGGTTVVDAARNFVPGMMEETPTLDRCLSFGYGKPLEIGRGGAILTNNPDLFLWAKRATFDGRDTAFIPWEKQKTFNVGYHYRMLPEEAIIGLNKLEQGNIGPSVPGNYPDLRGLAISAN